jgi:exodeoxyribonuclease III
MITNPQQEFSSLLFNRMSSDAINLTPYRLEESKTPTLDVIKPPVVSLMSWNINGLRSYFRHDPRGEVINSLIVKYRPDFICLQETRIQNSHVAEVKSELVRLFNCKSVHLSCSQARKGYSGTAILGISEAADDKSVSYGIGETEGDQEGRTIILRHPQFSLINVYSPNSGEALSRLNYRTNIWDRMLRARMDKLILERPHIPVIIAGDLNVAHKYTDFYCWESAGSLKQPGLTIDERNSFQNTILGSDFIDTFRASFPDTIKYSYFSSRSKHISYPQKRGFRLDYILTNAQRAGLKVSHHKPFVDDSVRL